MLFALIAGISFITDAQIQTQNILLTKTGSQMHLSAALVLDSLELKSNSQIFVTPVIKGENNETAVLPTILVTGRGMHYAYERGTMRGLKDFRSRYDIQKEIQRRNGKPQTVEYLGTTPMQPWMRFGNLSVNFQYDNCGCGVSEGSQTGPGIDTTFNPVRKMHLAFVSPRVAELPVAIHEGRARVQFEVNKTELHDSVFRCRNGQKIDNRSQLKVIYDSLEYALNDPNVEISKIEIIGYASPESPYEHNRILANGRSKALADYISRYVGKKYNISQNLTTFDAVPENWAEFRDQVATSRTLTDTQRADLLELIDRPAVSPADYDAKEKELKTDPRFRDLYKSVLLPEWFPHLRATKFRIGTRLKPMSDSQLAEVIVKSPEKMTLNQMMRVANLYYPGSEDFMKVIDTTLKYYPDNEEANLNAAVASLAQGNYQRAEQLLQKVGNQAEAQNARAILLTEKGDIKGAIRLLESVAELPAAKENLKILYE